MVVQRYRCLSCGATHSDEDADLPPRAWYARSVRRLAMDWWLHGGSSLRRVAEMVRSLVGHQERWHMWHPTRVREAGAAHCRLSHSTLQRWLDQAGERATRQTEGLYAEVPCTGQLGADGLWARLRGGAKRVLLNRGSMDDARRLARSVEYIELSVDPRFTDLYVEHIPLPAGS